MTPSNADETASPQTEERDERLLAAVQAYVAEVEGGRKPNRQEFVARYPDIATELSACLQGVAFLNSAVAEIDSSRPKSSLDKGGGPPADDSGLHEGQPLGDFKLVREVGRGGMGVVYEAVQLSLNRRVALKILPLASALDPRHLQRFRNEAHAAAQLHHGGIVPVYAVGSERSVHFYAMQLIDGHSLADVIAELRSGSPSTPNTGSATGAGAAAATATASSVSSSTPSDSKDSLSAYRITKRGNYHRAVARLGLQAAEALEYAHQRGVVHRDIKPANLLLDARGQLWVTDFGLAQMYANTGLTQPGDVLGTYRYMSPEQANGSALLLDERTDIYSLGATLYELLTLERAFTGETRESLLYAITHVDPRPPRTLDRTIPAELETIIGKAMSKSAGDRYRSAGEMAADLRRFLADEPIRARPPSVWDKAVKWVRRHKAVAGAVVAVLLLSSVGLAVSTALVARAQARTREALASESAKRTQARQQQLRAEQSMREAHEVVTAFSRFATEEMPKDLRLYRLRTRMLDSAMRYNKNFIDERRDDPAAAKQVAEAEAWASNLRDELEVTHRLVDIETQFQLLQHPGVQRELGVRSERVEQIRAPGRTLLSPPPLDESAEESMTDVQKRDHLISYATNQHRQVLKLLNAGQVRRLQQLSVQARGLYAFSDPAIVPLLGLTPDQRTAIAAIESEVIESLNNRAGPPPHPHPGLGGPDGPGGPGDPRGRPGRGEEERRLSDDALSRALQLLTPTQTAAWEQLTGPAPAEPLPPTGLRPRGPGGTGGGGNDGPQGRGEGRPDGRRRPPFDGPPPFDTPPPFDGPPPRED